jgi:hypothetical protein
MAGKSNHLFAVGSKAHIFQVCRRLQQRARVLGAGRAGGLAGGQAEGGLAYSSC